MFLDRSPVAVFGFNRPQHLRRTLLALSLNEGAEDTEVYIFIDGPRSSKDAHLCEDVAKVAKNNYGFREQHVVISTANKGLRRSIVEGVTSVVTAKSRIIVLEDDLVPSLGFLEYMNDALKKYESVPRVGSIHAFQYPLGYLGNKSLFFRGADCWGWATWADRWKLLQQDPRVLLRRLESGNLVEQFNLSGKMNFTELLEKQFDGLIDSWAILWHASLFLEEKLTLYPPKSLIQNIGQDGSGTHGGSDQHHETEITNYVNWGYPDKIEESMEFRTKLGNYYQQIHKPSGLYRLRLFLSRLLK